MMASLKRLKRDSEREDSNQAMISIGLAFATMSVPFPEEVMEQIFSHLDTVQDLKNVSNVSEQFERIVRHTKLLWLFEEVFPIIFPKLDKMDILNCRSICKKWKNSVDIFLQQQPHTRLTEGYNVVVPASKNVPAYAPQFPQNLVRKQLMYIELHEVDAVSRFMKDASKSNSTSENPFFLRSVSFDGGVLSIAQQNPYWIQVYELLSTYGHHIWHLYFTICPTDTNLPPVGIYCYNILHCCLSLMPNLKSLAICQFSHIRRPEWPILDHVARLKRHIHDIPLPRLPYLESIELELPTSEGNKQVNHELMRRYFDHTKTIILHLSHLKISKNTRQLFTDQLTTLYVYVDVPLPHWNYICNALQAPNLAKLSLALHINTSISKTLMELRNFPSLRYLRLRFNYRPTDLRFGINDVPTFGLGRIKTLEVVDSPHVPYSLLFAHLPKLEYVLICGEESWLTVGDIWNMEHRHSFFKNWSFTQSLHGKDIWTRLEALKEFSLAWMGTGFMESNEVLRTKRYTREMFKTNQK